MPKQITVDKIDFKKEFKAYYSPKAGKPEIITMPPTQFVMIDGAGGSPEKNPAFTAAVGALYSCVYGLKFGRKKAGLTPDFSVGPLEGLWWTNKGKMFDIGNPKNWVWTLMIWLPDSITQDAFSEFKKDLATKKPELPINNLRLETFDEGLAVQIMHVGPYATEPASVKLMHEFAKAQGYLQSGKHHEIYLGDPRRSAPEKLRTIIRHPITKA